MSCANHSQELTELSRQQARYAPAELRVDTTKLDAGDHQALAKILEAARIIDEIFRTQVWSGNAALRERLVTDKSELGKARLRYFDLNQGPWSDLDEHAAFLPDAPKKKLPGANFYPEDMTKPEFEAWLVGLTPEQKEEAIGFFTVIRRDASGKLHALPYSQAYQPLLERAGVRLEEAAGLTSNASLKSFLQARAEAFLTNDYYASDVAWMKVDAPSMSPLGRTRLTWTNSSAIRPRLKPTSLFATTPSRPS